uniref:ATP synthase subunit a n=1 Tax=Decemunciger sp. AB-2017 TaxID=1980157 RepID=A0A1X9ZNR2_9ANNE|nr:ATP synthase F0 subunit 6 [Decemunciger sp. AB-2017]
MSSTFLISTSFWAPLNRLSKTIFGVLNFMLDTRPKTGSKLKGMDSTLSLLFLFLIMLNLMGLIPYMFSASSHLVMTMSIGLPIWLSVILSGLVKSPYSFFAHLLPNGAPWWLSPFLVLVETISTVIRPITLSFRLAANMSAGHIVLTLLGVYSSSSFFNSWVLFSLLLLTQTFYLLFEICICMIQAYIFCLLSSLYSDEHPTN